MFCKIIPEPNSTKYFIIKNGFILSVNSDSSHWKATIFFYSKWKSQFWHLKKKIIQNHGKNHIIIEIVINNDNIFEVGLNGFQNQIWAITQWFFKFQFY